MRQLLYIAGFTACCLGCNMLPLKVHVYPNITPVTLGGPYTFLITHNALVTIATPKRDFIPCGFNKCLSDGSHVYEMCQCEKAATNTWTEEF